MGGWYIDDLICVSLYIDDYDLQTTRAIMLAISSFARPVIAFKTLILHPYILLMKKWIAEGTQEESKILVG